MMRNIRRTFLNLTVIYPNPLEAQRARILLGLNWLVLLAWLIWLSVTLAGAIFTNVTIERFQLIGFVLAPVMFLGVQLLVPSGRLNLALWLFVGVLLVSMASPATLNVYDVDTMLVVVPLVAAGVLLGRRGLLLTSLVVIVIVLMGAFDQSQDIGGYAFIPSETVTLDLVVSLTILLMVMVFMYLFGGGTQRLMSDALTDVRQFQMVARFVARVRRNVEEDVYVGVLKLLQNDLQYNFAQIFTVDDNGHIDQRLRLRQRGASGLNTTDINLNATNALYESVRGQRAVMVFASDNALRRDHFLPSSAFGLVVPITIDGVPVAVIDVQDNDTSFSETSMQAISMLAEQAGKFIKDIRMINDLRANLSEQEIAAANLRNQLRELRQRESSVIGSAWETYMEERGQRVFGFDLIDEQAMLAHDLPKALLPALRDAEIHVEEAEGVRLINVPIILRGEVLGAMTFEVPASAPLDERQLDMARAVASRLAVALENKRLFEQSEARALRERKANQIANLLIGASDVDSVMKLAADTFNEALGAVRTRIYVQPDEENGTR
ncbi:MAG: hypothetical protein OHK0046_49280 [Anaerolineae bacterium]